MNNIKCRLTVFFQDPFWVGVYEIEQNSILMVSKITFGSEPKDYEVYEFLINNWMHIKFSSGVSAGTQKKDIPNPKRLKRAINKELSKKNIGTKAQLALKLQQEERALSKKTLTKEKQKEESLRKYNLKKKKKKERHRGR